MTILRRATDTDGSVSSGWFLAHSEYLASPEWQDRRQRVLERDGHKCQAELPGCLDRASQVHHTSYKHWKAEPLWELVAVCSVCHDQITHMDRRRVS